MSRPSRTSRRPASRASAVQTSPGQRATVWPFVAIALAGLVVYANALGHPFIFDDSASIVENQSIRAISTSLLGGPFQLPTAGRPLVNAAFALNYAVAGVEPWGYHAVNLALHILCGMVLFALLRDLFPGGSGVDVTVRRGASLDAPLWSGLKTRPYVPRSEATGLAAAVATIWVVHPINSEIVNYATQRTEVMMALAFLTTLHAGVRALTSERARLWQALSVLACATGMACKESMVTAPVMMLLVDATFFSGGVAAALRRRPAFYIALFASWTVLAALIIEGPRWHSAGFASGVSPLVYLLNQAPLITRYLTLVFWPASLVLDYGEPMTTTFAAVAPSFLFLSLLIVATAVAWFRAPLLALAGTWFFVTLAPTSSIVPIATEVGAERRMYLPGIAIIAVIVVAVWTLARMLIGSSRTRSLLLGSIAAVVICALGARTMARNTEYTSPRVIWQTVVDRYPTGRAHYNLGLELKAAGRRDEALAHYRLALATSPDAHYAMGFELDEDGRHQEAIAEYQAFIDRKPLDANVPRAYHQIGRDLMALGRGDDAIAAFRQVLARSPGNVDAIGGMADIQMAGERWGEAAASYAEYVRLNPSNTSARLNLGLALLHLQRFSEAAQVLNDLVETDPRMIAARVNLGTALASMGRGDEAVRVLTQAAQMETDPEGRRAIADLIREVQSAK